MKNGPESLSADSGTREHARAEFASERRNEAAKPCDLEHVGAGRVQVWSTDVDAALVDDPEGDAELADMLPAGWWVTTCPHCGTRIEHTSINPAYVEIAEALHRQGSCA